jgi:hypothetical protein
VLTRPPLWHIGSPPMHIDLVIHSISCVNYSLFIMVNENSSILSLLLLLSQFLSANVCGIF